MNAYVEPRIAAFACGRYRPQPCRKPQRARHLDRAKRTTAMISRHVAILATFLLVTVAPLKAQSAHGSDVDLGARLYFNHCAACHGQDGEGGGPVAATMHIA